MSVFVISPAEILKNSDNGRHGSTRTRKGYSFNTGNKALRGKPHGHFKHETGLKEPMNQERQEGNQTLKMFVTGEASSVRRKFFGSYVPKGEKSHERMAEKICYVHITNRYLSR